MKIFKYDVFGGKFFKNTRRHSNNNSTYSRIGIQNKNNIHLIFNAKIQNNKKYVLPIFQFIHSFVLY